MSLYYEWIDENQCLNQFIPYNDTNGKVNVYVFDSNKNNYEYKFCYYIPSTSVPQNAVIKSSQQNDSTTLSNQQNDYTTLSNQQVQQNDSTTLSNQQEIQYVENNNIYSFIGTDGSQIVLNTTQTIAYLYTIASQSLQKIALLEKSLSEESNKNVLLTQKIETYQHFSEELYKVNQNISNEYYKFQQNQLMKMEHNNLNKKIEYLNRKNNRNSSTVINMDFSKKHEENKIEDVKKIQEEDVKKIEEEDVKKIEEEDVKKVEIEKLIIQTKEKKISWCEMNETDDDEEEVKKDENKVKKSYAQIIGNNSIINSNVNSMMNSNYDLKKKRNNRNRIRNRNRNDGKNPNYNPERNVNNRKEEDGWVKVGKK